MSQLLVFMLCSLTSALMLLCPQFHQCWYPPLPCLFAVSLSPLRRYDHGFYSYICANCRGAISWTSTVFTCLLYCCPLSSCFISVPRLCCYVPVLSLTVISLRSGGWGPLSRNRVHVKVARFSWAENSTTEVSK